MYKETFWRRRRHYWLIALMMLAGALSFSTSPAAAACTQESGTVIYNSNPDAGGEVSTSSECNEDGSDGSGPYVPFPNLSLWCGGVRPGGGPAVSYVENWGGDASGYGVDIGGETIFGPVAAAVYQNGTWGDYTLYPDVQYTFLTVTCSSAGGASVDLNFIYGGVPAIDPIALRDAARARILLDDPPAGSNPPFDDPDRFGVVRIPTWFWIDGAYWTPQTESESQGAVSVTVTATPILATWEVGDGSPPVLCLDAGVPWVPGSPEDGTLCKHTYTQSSAGQPGDEYRLSVTVDWEFTWTLNGADQGVFGTDQVITEFTYQVGEIQAIERS